MRNLFLILISVFLFSAVSAQITKTYYTCVMHPEVQMDKPGKCPKCRMTLVKKTIKLHAQNPANQESEKMNMDTSSHNHSEEDSSTNEAVTDELISNRENLLQGKTEVYHIYV